MTGQKAGSPVAHRGLVALALMAATIMVAIDTTIANVALPQMQGAMGATQDQISWVLTSYIVAGAICLPLTGILSARLGRKRILLWSALGFTVASMLCGAAQTIGQIVLFRLLQGMFGATLAPLSQAVMLDIYPPEQHGAAMSLWGMGIMVGPILGPTLGGWLTEYYNWRWVFYINLPIGILAWLGLSAWLQETRIDRRQSFDMLGFLFLAVGLGALQLLLDRGESIGWFDSSEAVVEAMLAGLCLYLFLVHICTHKRPFIEPEIFRDRNFTVGLIFTFTTSMVMMATLTLLPSYMQNLLGHPVVDVGHLIAVRGCATMLAIMVAGRLTHRVDPRYMVLIGMSLALVGLWDMTSFSLDTSDWDLIRSGVLQSAGLGLINTTVTTLTFSTLAPHRRNEGTALNSLMRNIGNSIGISILVTVLIRNTQVYHGILAELATPFSLPLRQAVEAGAADLGSMAGLAALDAEVTRQAAMLAYLQDFRIVIALVLAFLPLLLLLRPLGRPPAPVEVDVAGGH